MSLGVSVRVARAQFVLDVSFTVASGETIGVVGPNGAGKTTLVRALAGLVDVDGDVELDGAVLGPRPQDRPIGTVFQDLRLFPHMSALDNVAFAVRARGLRRSPARTRAREALERMHLAHRAHARPHELSGGEAQQVALARALVTEPRVLLLDEPLSALDVAARRRVRSVLGDVLSAHDGMAVVVSHDPVDVMTLADRIVIIEGGRIVQHGAPDEIRRAPSSPYAAELVGVNVYRGRLQPLEDGAARLLTGDGELVVAVLGPVPSGPAAAVLKPSDVSVHTVRPAGSARNVLLGPVSSIALGDRARVAIASSPPVVAELTLGSARALSLREGMQVYASFKATEIGLVDGPEA